MISFLQSIFTSFFDGIETIINYITLLVDVVIRLLSDAFQVLLFVPKAISYITSSFLFLPTELLFVIEVILALSVVYLIIGRIH